MKISKARYSLVLLILSVSTVSLLVSDPDRPAALVVTPPAPPQVATVRPLFPVELYAAAAQALRENDLQEARQALADVAARHPEQAANARVLSGLYAYAGGEIALARQTLSSIEAPGGLLEDWRLYLLAHLEAQDGKGDLAGPTFDRLLREHPRSPLRAVACLEAAELARKQGQERLALDLIAQGRQEGDQGEIARRLDQLAWGMARKLEDGEMQKTAGRRLLIEAPFSLDARDAARTFRALGDVERNRLLSPSDVVRRAQSFLEAASLPAALSTLDSLPESERGFDWHLLKASALTQSQQGQEALDLLEGFVPANRAEEAAVEWERALAAAEVATSLDAAARRSLLDRSYRHLTEVARLDADIILSAGALRWLYDDYLDAGLFDPAMGTLKLLRQVDPIDETGARSLWESGWAAYRRGDLQEAVGYWAQLEAIYPDHRDAHRGSYWKARALEGLGQPEQAHAAYRELVASTDTSDFYGRQALDQLGLAPQPGTPALARAGNAGPWPSEPALRRAKVLLDLGLDDLAMRESELAGDEASPRDRLTLKALLLGRQGRLRESLVLLREAYPALGGPYQGTVPVEILRAYYPVRYEEAIRASARRVGLPPHLVAGIIRQESAFDPRATSPVGARGLMQLMPDTAREISRKLDIPYVPSGLYDPNTSVLLGAAYFKQLLDAFDGNVELALASYNGGPNRIRRMWTEASGTGAGLDDFVENLSIEESRDYVKRILVLADSYRQLYPSLES